MAYNESPPQPGNTITSGCDCNKGRPTTWTVTKALKFGNGEGYKSYRYCWVCLNCGKERVIGIWDSNGNIAS
jgi:hypothetical protein